jgi:hypothetical protein
VLYRKVKDFVQDSIFDQKEESENPSTMQNLSELEVLEGYRTLQRQSILTVNNKGNAEIKYIIKLRQTRTFRARM